MLGNIGMPELLVIFLFILIFFGAKKIPEIAKGLGQGMREFRRAMKDVEETVQHHSISDLLDDKSPKAAELTAPKKPVGQKETAKP